MPAVTQLASEGSYQNFHLGGTNAKGYYLSASYYFANIAWSLYYKKPEEARPWVLSAGRIYDPDKLNLYGRCLIDLGYLPLPPPPQE